MAGGFYLEFAAAVNKSGCTAGGSVLIERTKALVGHIQVELGDYLERRVHGKHRHARVHGVDIAVGKIHRHRAAAALIEAGADVERLNEQLFECRSHARIEIERVALSSLEYYFEGRCALICLTWDQIQGTGVAGAELEDLTSLPRSIEGVEVGLTLRQQKDGSYKISVRTGHNTNACNIARRLGGGGHPRAAGCEISGNLDNAKYAILEEVKKELDRSAQEQTPEA